jgi:hypothetical protein
MSKRKGDVRVEDFMVSNFAHIVTSLNISQAKGWEPAAVTNWLAIAGRNFNNPDISSESLLDIRQLINSVRIRAFTPVFSY